VFVLPLSNASGKAGGLRGMSEFAGMGTEPCKAIQEGLLFENLQLIEGNCERREDLRLQLEWRRAKWPERIPAEVVEHAFNLGDRVDHDCQQLTSNRIAEVMGYVDVVFLAPLCHGMSALGMQLGMEHARSGAVVALRPLWWICNANGHGGAGTWDGQMRLRNSDIWWET
jgi:hypothetical protein